MARFRLSRLAQADLARILAASAERWGSEGQRRYAAMLADAVRKVAAEPEGPTTRARSELGRRLRSLHLQYSRAEARRAKVKRPSHILYYLVIAPDVIEIVRIFDERMDPRRHLPRRPEERD
jgi:toxin ParE1/3/4